MYLCDQWRDYEVLDTGDGEKLERWGDIILRRPDPQVIWPKARPELWEKADAVYARSETGGGHWDFRKKLPERWTITLGMLKFYVKPTGFKHTGLFPDSWPVGPAGWLPEMLPSGQTCPAPQRCPLHPRRAQPDVSCSY